MTGLSTRARLGFGVMLFAAVAALSSPAVASGLPERVATAGDAARRPRIVILPSTELQMAAGANTSCSCGAFTCKGKEFPACTMTCVEPETAVCECGFCERTMGSPNSGALGPVANDCACH